MDEELDTLTPGGPPPHEITKRRLLGWMVAFVIAAAAAGFMCGPARFGWGILVGGVLAFANYFWLDRSTRSIFDNANVGIMPSLLAVRYILRYIALGLVLWLIYKTDVVPVVAAIVGLSAFAMAVVADGMYGIFRSIFIRKS